MNLLRSHLETKQTVVFGLTGVRIEIMIECNLFLRPCFYKSPLPMWPPLYSGLFLRNSSLSIVKFITYHCYWYHYSYNNYYQHYYNYNKARSDPNRLLLNPSILLYEILFCSLITKYNIHSISKSNIWKSNNSTKLVELRGYQKRIERRTDDRTDSLPSSSSKRKGTSLRTNSL